MIDIWLNEDDPPILIESARSNNTSKAWQHNNLENISMSFLKKLFGLKESKIELIRRLTKARLRADTVALAAGIDARTVDSHSDYVIMGSTEGTIVTIVESYVGLKRQGLRDNEIFRRIEHHRSGWVNGVMPPQPTLQEYIHYRLMIESNGHLVSAHLVDHSIQEAMKHFGSA